MISGPISSRRSCGMPFTVAKVPTGMKTGVSMVPCGVASWPRRAGPVVVWTLKVRDTWGLYGMGWPKLFIAETLSHKEKPQFQKKIKVIEHQSFNWIFTWRGWCSSVSLCLRGEKHLELSRARAAIGVRTGAG